MCCTNLVFHGENNKKKDVILLVTALEGNYQKQSMCQIKVFDREAKEDSIHVAPLEWMRIYPVEKQESEGDEEEKIEDPSVHWKIIRLVVLRQFFTEVDIGQGDILPLFELLTTDGKGLTLIWRVYAQRVGENEYEFKLRHVAEYQIMKKSQVF
jgi:hypothetical protein